jgi:hypothetical protein
MDMGLWLGKLFWATCCWLGEGREIDTLLSYGRSACDIKLLEIYNSVLNRDAVLKNIAPGFFVYWGGAREVK